jgi:hypothetical protein
MTTLFQCTLTPLTFARMLHLILVRDRPISDNMTLRYADFQVSKYSLLYLDF